MIQRRIVDTVSSVTTSRAYMNTQDEVVERTTVVDGGKS